MVGVKPSEAEHKWDYLVKPCYSEDAEAVHVAQKDVRAPYEVRSDGLLQPACDGRSSSGGLLRCRV